MVNSKGGSGYKKSKKDSGDTTQLVIKGEEQEYARVLRALGSGRFECLLLGGNKETIMGILRGKLKTQKWKNMVSVGGYVLISYREYQKDKCEIIHTYKDKDVSELKSLGEIVDTVDKEEEEDGGVIIGGVEDEIEGERTVTVPKTKQWEVDWENI